MNINIVEKIINKIRSVTLFLLLLSVLYTNQAHALACGDSVTSNVTLTADLRCTSGYQALEVFAHNVTIDLNGFTISGNSSLQGILITGYSNVTVKNGAIEGFWAGINTTDSNNLKVHDMVFFEVGSAVIIGQGNKANIYDNDFIKTTGQAIYIFNRDRILSASNHTIDNNEFYRARVGIEVCGDRSDSNTITNNLIWKSADRGIELNTSDFNYLGNNRVLETGGAALRMNGSSYNRIDSNSFREGDHTGISILAKAGDACLDSGLYRSYGNQITSNHSIGFTTGITVGEGISKGAYVFSNTIKGNKLYDNDIGIFFNDNAYFNEAMGNAYQGTATPVVDLGFGNSY